MKMKSLLGTKVHMLMLINVVWSRIAVDGTWKRRMRFLGQQQRFLANATVQCWAGLVGIWLVYNSQWGASGSVFPSRSQQAMALDQPTNTT